MITTKVESFALTEAEQKFFEENGYVGPFTLYQPEEMEQIKHPMPLLSFTSGALHFESGPRRRQSGISPQIFSADPFM